MILFLWVLNLAILYEITSIAYLLMNLPDDTAVLVGICTLISAVCLLILTLKWTLVYVRKLYKRKDFKL